MVLKTNKNDKMVTIVLFRKQMKITERCFEESRVNASIGKYVVILCLTGDEHYRYVMLL